MNLSLSLAMTGPRSGAAFVPVQLDVRTGAATRGVWSTAWIVPTFDAAATPILTLGVNGGAVTQAFYADNAEKRVLSSEVATWLAGSGFPNELPRVVSAACQGLSGTGATFNWSNATHASRPGVHPDYVDENGFLYILFPQYAGPTGEDNVWLDYGAGISINRGNHAIALVGKFATNVGVQTAPNPQITMFEVGTATGVNKVEVNAGSGVFTAGQMGLQSRWGSTPTDDRSGLPIPVNTTLVVESQSTAVALSGDNGTAAAFPSIKWRVGDKTFVKLTATTQTSAGVTSGRVGRGSLVDSGMAMALLAVVTYANSLENISANEEDLFYENIKAIFKIDDAYTSAGQAIGSSSWAGYKTRAWGQISRLPNALSGNPVIDTYAHAGTSYATIAAGIGGITAMKRSGFAKNWALVWSARNQINSLVAAATIYADFMTIVNALNAAGIRVFTATQFNTDYSPNQAACEAIAATYNALLLAGADQVGADRYSCVDLATDPNTATTIWDNWADTNYFYTDGIHCIVQGGDLFNLAIGGLVNPYLAEPVVIPALQTVPFGADTRTGYGASLCQYSGSGTLEIVSQKDASAADVTIFRMTQNGLNWRGAATTYGSAPPSPLNGPYTVTVREIESGQTSIITVPILASTAHVREMTSVANGGRWVTDLVYTTDVPGGNSWQIGISSNTAGHWTLGETVVCRDGVFNPYTSNNIFRIKPLAAYGGAGVITITSETIDTSVDANGVPNRNHGAILNYLYVDAGTSGDVYMPFLFDSVVMQTTGNSGLATCFKYANTSGWGFNFNNCRFEAGPNPARLDPWVLEGIQLRGTAANPAYVTDCTFDGLGYGIRVNRSASADNVGALIQDCDFVRLWSDGIVDTKDAVVNYCPSGTQVLDNFFRDWQSNAASIALDIHADLYQHQGNTDGASRAGPTIRRNIAISNYDVASWSFQCFFFDDSTGASRLTGIVIEDNITEGQLFNQVFLNRCDAPIVRFNTIIPTVSGDIKAPDITVSASWIAVPSGGGGTDLTATHNVVPQLSGMGNQGGTVTTTPNALIPTVSPPATALAQRVTALPGYTETGIYTRAQAIAMATPANLLIASGGYKNPDLTMNGALKPSGAWNDGAPV